MPRFLHLVSSRDMAVTAGDRKRTISRMSVRAQTNCRRLVSSKEVQVADFYLNVGATLQSMRH